MADVPGFWPVPSRPEREPGRIPVAFMYGLRADPGRYVVVVGRKPVPGLPTPRILLQFLDKQVSHVYMQENLTIEKECLDR